MTTPMGTITIIVLTRGRALLLRSCLESVLKADLRDVLDILVVANGAEEESLAVATSFIAREPRIRAVPIPLSSRGTARTLAAREARGAVVHFLDDDLVVDPGLFVIAARRFAQDPQLAAVGGPNLTPGDSSPFERAVGRILSSRLGAWRMRARYIPVGEARDAGEESLMLCSLAFRADADGSDGLKFDGALVSAEENLLLERLRRRGGRLLYDPAMIVQHRRRSTAAGFLRQTLTSGAGRVQAITRLRGGLRLCHFAPAAFLVAAVGLSVPLVRTPAVAALITYAIWLAIETAAVLITDGPMVAWRFAALMPCHHAAYAAGMALAPWLWQNAGLQRFSTTNAPPIPPPAQAASIP